MLISKILCVVLLSKYVVSYSRERHVSAQTYSRNVDVKVNNTKDLIFKNCSKNVELHTVIEGNISGNQSADLPLTSPLQLTSNYEWDDNVGNSKVIDIEKYQTSNKTADLLLEPSFNGSYLKFDLLKTAGFHNQYLCPNFISVDCLTSNFSNDTTGKTYKGDCTETNWKDRLHEETTPTYNEKDDIVNYAPTIEKHEHKNPINNITTFMDIVNLIHERIGPLKLVSIDGTTEGLNRSRNKMNSNDHVMNLYSKYRAKKYVNDVRRRIKRAAPPECPSEWGLPSIWGTTKPDNLHKYDANRTGDLVAKCYVCGLEDERIPFTAICSDAFSADGPLTQHKHHFKKYCRYRYDEGNYCVKSKDPRSVWGHWTGGCALRRIDISGLYTERTCRNEIKPTMGHSFTSHRMAKLELTLNGVKEGCVLSPGASLVPFSRSVSLYARFQACVCTGHLCNIGLSHFSPSYVTCVAMCTLLIIMEAFVY